MPTQSFSIPEGNCPAGTKTVSPSTIISNNPTRIVIQMTSTEWESKAGLGTVRWGIERSPDGSIWDEWISNPSPGDSGLVFGTHNRGGGLPIMAFSGGAMTQLVGYRVRLFADVVGTSIRLGANLTVDS